MLNDEQLEIKNKWLEALRSGNYKQCTGYLHKGEGYCCLGVLEDILGAEWELAPGSANTVYRPVGTQSIYMTSYSFDDSLNSIDIINQAAIMNDNGKSFSQIASYLEAELQ